MKNMLIPIVDKMLLKKKFIIETINDQVKNMAQIEQSRHRSPIYFLLNLVSALTAYQARSKKPVIYMSVIHLSFQF